MKNFLLRRFYSRSLSFRLYLLIIPTTILAIALYGYLSARVARRMLDAQVEKSTMEIATELAADLAGNNAPKGPDRLHHWLEEWVEANFFITRIDLFEVSGTLKRIDSTSGSSTPSVFVDESIAVKQSKVQVVNEYRGTERLLKVIAPFVDPSSGKAGCVSVTSSLRQSDLFVETHDRIALVLVPAFVMVLILMLHFLFTRVMTRRIDQLSHAMTAARNGNLKMRVPELYEDELGIIGRRFNDTMDDIEAAWRERDRLVEELKSFNIHLQEKIDDATQEISSANAQLLKVNEDLLESQRLLTQYERMAVAGQLAASFAHEIGSPLSAISTHLELLLEDARGHAESKRRIQLIQDQLSRITRFVEDLLSETRLAAEVRNPIQVNDVLKQTLLFLEQHLKKHRIKIEADLIAGLPQIIADGHQLQQVFLNLFNNACDAMPEGGTIRIVTGVETGREGRESVLVTISDTGCGIAQEKQADIFEPFFTTKDLRRGSGLGLSIVARIVRQHNGTIEFQSTPNVGTTFKLRFPALPVPAARIMVVGAEG